MEVLLYLGQVAVSLARLFRDVEEARLLGLVAKILPSHSYLRDRTRRTLRFITKLVGKPT